MKLYHFTPEHLLPEILKDGITKGVLPVFNDDDELEYFLPNCQWLTAEPYYYKQSWAPSHLIDYDRTACRLTITIPKSHRHKLIPAIDFVSSYSGLTKRCVTEYAGSEKWYVFLDRIPAGWIRQIDFKRDMT